MGRGTSRRRAAATQRRRRNYMLYPGLSGAGSAVVAIVFAALISSNGSTGNPAAEFDGSAKDFSFALNQGGQELDGKKLNLAELRRTPVVLNFWAGLCPLAALKCRTSSDFMKRPSMMW